MASCLLYECDVCKKTEQSRSNNIPKDWYEFEYDYTDISGKEKSLTYLVCRIRCYTIMLDRCLGWSLEHSKVRIAGMTVNFVKKLIENSNLQSHIERNELEISKNTTTTQYFKTSLEIPSSGKITQLRIDSSEELNWLIDFALENNNQKLLNKMLSVWEKDNLVLYDSMIDTEMPNIPLIRYKTHYILFIYEANIVFFESLKQENHAA